MNKESNKFFPLNIVTLSQQLSWSNINESSVIDNDLKRSFYTQKIISTGWGLSDHFVDVNKMIESLSVCCRRKVALNQKYYSQKKTSKKWKKAIQNEKYTILNFEELGYE